MTVELLFEYGSHQKWCEMLRRNVLSCVVHIISDVIRNPENPQSRNAFYRNETVPLLN